ncbi:DUF2938 family protein [Mesorhizobium sp. NBSH29]|uniref:DUF2938 domain-containing protein n=1 Tax=Mesorhizobium sp. NBSH29 TaxID=2654249 RepID=UPI0018969ACE|nr:DUF2938 domain-containing protein [Mesorhizobium sp. NBSH29]QPC87026.1 DUF2938 family protein [Mesorhizobium sp. NBSH29]
MFDDVWRSIAIGIGATILMDLWAVVLNLAFGLPRPNWGMVGRWVWHLKDGVLTHDDISRAGPYKNEKALGWAFHYLIGILYGVALVLIAGAGWLDSPSFLPAFILSIVTVGAGWFILSPGLGNGIAASRHPTPNVARGLNLVSHTVFAIGLFGTALMLS